MTSSAPEPHQPVRPSAALAYAVIGFIALLIAGLGVASLLLDADVIGVEGLGAMPGVAGATAATALFAAAVWAAVRAVRPSYVAAAAAAPAAFVGYLGGVWIGALVTGTDLARASAAVGGFATSPFALVLLLAAFVSAWVAVALVRTRARHPRWPWESDDEP